MTVAGTAVIGSSYLVSRYRGEGSDPLAITLWPMILLCLTTAFLAVLMALGRVFLEKPHEGKINVLFTLWVAIVFLTGAAQIRGRILWDEDVRTARGIVTELIHEIEEYHTITGRFPRDLAELGRRDGDADSVTVKQNGVRFVVNYEIDKAGDAFVSYRFLSHQYTYTFSDRTWRDYDLD
jgi:hypothetical protein